VDKRLTDGNPDIKVHIKGSKIKSSTSTTFNNLYFTITGSIEFKVHTLNLVEQLPPFQLMLVN